MISKFCVTGKLVLSDFQHNKCDILWILSNYIHLKTNNNPNNNKWMSVCLFPETIFLQTQRIIFILLIELFLLFTNIHLSCKVKTLVKRCISFFNKKLQTHLIPQDLDFGFQVHSFNIIFQSLNGVIYSSYFQWVSMILVEGLVKAWSKLIRIHPFEQFSVK